MSDSWIDIADKGGLVAAINPFGAELSSLRDPAGRELMTDANPAFWTGRAPLLFPIVGTLQDDRYRLDGTSYPLPRHGFARRQAFTPVEQGKDRLLLRLTDTQETRAVYPFAFALDAEFRITGATLVMTVTATNRSGADMPASFGFHPGFSWPLPYGRPRAAHRIVFDHDEPAPLLQLEDGLVARDDRPSPVEGSVLPLEDGLFADDALIWDRLASSSLVYGADGGPSLLIAWGGTPHLGIWTKPGAHFICVEPWAGLADRAGYAGEIWDKPGMRRIGPGASASWWMSVTLQEG